MNRRWALALPATRAAKSESESWRVTLHQSPHISIEILILSFLYTRREHTISLTTLRSSALADFTLVLQIQIPALLLAIVVLNSKGNNSLSLLNSILTLSSVSLEDAVDDVESGGGGESVWLIAVSQLQLLLLVGL